MDIPNIANFLDSPTHITCLKFKSQSYIIYNYFPLKLDIIYYGPFFLEWPRSFSDDDYYGILSRNF